MRHTLNDYVKESLYIEGILRDPTQEELDATSEFVRSDLTIRSLMKLLHIYEPKAKLRDNKSLNVRVGNHLPPLGGMNIIYALEELITLINSRKVSTYDAHVAFETLHPFTDGNGRTGRALWLRQLIVSNRSLNLSFLHWWYYASLDNSRSRV